MGSNLLGDAELSISVIPFVFLFVILVVIAVLIRMLFRWLPRQVFNFLVSCGLLAGAFLWGYLTFYAEWFPYF
ncbi:hypothetical protein IHV09_22060 [Fictibacillus sp. 23RED33]|uniref:hypothetical protein n=1 Tax=Fictibacillus sp. 23RED33 TaxID=2745879 RepID=UPI0018CED654|nr:hypothetical protein [Fictibacillus sp. 23RED33]MBH0176245.1 hypothetical protein [Fictibacillus sp. 23RED33]